MMYYHHQDADENAELNWINHDFFMQNVNEIGPPNGSGEEDCLIPSINFNNSHLSTLFKTRHPSY